MDINYPPILIDSLKNKHLLLDANIFRDFASKPSVFTSFFIDLKKSGVTLTTLDFIIIELLKGSADITKYKEKEKLINDITEGVIIPINQEMILNAYKLIKQYGIDGASISVTDIILGASLIQFKKNLFLLTRDTTDFLQRIFELSSIINIPCSKGIFTYGVYQYTQ